jgi:ABC-type cobalamin/Fe3+-siderophores transport system ATPase subunit
VVGSVWHRWDLHVHTPASFSHQFKLNLAASEDEYQHLIWENYIAALEKRSDVPALGITDYFSIEGYKRVQAYRNQGRLAGYELMLPNVEFRLDTIFTRNGNKAESVNYHVIFSDRLDPEIIEREFLECLDIKTSANEPRRLNRANIEEIGRQLKEQHPSFRRHPDYVVGCMNIKVSFDQLQDVLKQKPRLFAGNYLTVLALEGFKRQDWEGQAHLGWKRLFVGSDAVFSGHPQTREFLLGRVHEDPKTFLNAFEKFKPCLHGSDSHSFDTLLEPQGERYCWVKGELSFTGLRQVLYEPDARVAISPSRPGASRSVYTLAGVQFQDTGANNSVSMHNGHLSLNHGLIAVIGGKGSGKTALLDLIAHCFEDRCQRGQKARKDSSSFVQRIERDKPTLETNIQFLKGEQWSKRLQDVDTFERSRATYLPQGKIDDYSADAQKLHKKITELVFSTEDVFQSGYIKAYEELGSAVQKLQTEITETIGTIESYEAETTDEQRTERFRTLELKRGEFDDLMSQRDQHLIDEELKQKVEALDELINGLDARNRQLKQLDDDLEGFKSYLSNLFGMNLGASQLTDRLQEIGWRGQLPTIDFAPLTSAVENAQSYLFMRGDETTATMEEQRNKLAGLSQSQQAHSDLLEQIERKKDEIKRSETALKEFDVKRADTDAKKLLCKALYQTCLTKVHQQQEVYKQIIDLFSKEKDEIMSAIEFQARVTFDRDDFIEAARDLFHGRSVLDEDIYAMADALAQFGQAPDDDQLADAYFSSVMKFSSKLKTRRSTADLYRLMHRPVFRVETKVLFDSKPMETLSMGQKGTVLLTIFLAEGDHLLILDQPEENLDNRFVYEVLVGAIRAAKQRRQIIMATHNANLVVNTDAEQVIVANYNGGTISYSSGALENPEIRREVTTLLEGGEEAFKKREQRYRG